MRASQVLLAIAGLLVLWIVLSSVRLSQEQVLLLVALAIAVLVFRARRQIRTLPALVRIRHVANANLTGARLRWGPYWRRRHLTAITVINGSIIVLFSFLIGPLVGALLAASLLAWGTMSTFVRLFGEWYDGFLWGSRTLKLWGADPFPWNGNHHVWTRQAGKVVETLPESGEPPAITFKAPLYVNQFLVARESSPDQWWGKAPSDGYIAVFPVRKDAQPISDDGVISIGGGTWNGYQYEVTGVWRGYLLGGGWFDDIAEYLPEKYRALIDGLDPALRDFVYQHWPDAKPWSGVFFVEVAGDKLTSPKAPDATVLAQLQDARIELRQLRRDKDKTDRFHGKQLDRATRK